MTENEETKRNLPNGPGVRPDEGQRRIEREGQSGGSNLLGTQDAGGSERPTRPAQEPSDREPGEATPGSDS